MKRIRELIIFLFLFSLITGVVFAGGKTEAPEIPPVTSGTQYISPNGDGIKDSAELSFTVRLYVKSDEGYIPGYGLIITSPGGDVVYEERETEDSDIGWFASIFRGYDLFELERTVSWDGTNLEGEVVPDGEYEVTIEVRDATKNVSEIQVDSFVVDTVKPRVDITPPENLLFSPNGDGNRDVFIILQENGTLEDLWRGVIYDEGGGAVKTFTWENGPPEDVLWDGTNDEGDPLPDGTYSYSLSSTDRAGNTSDPYGVGGIILNAARPSLSLELDAERLSPNGDGVQDTVTVIPTFEEPEEILAWSWSLGRQEEVVVSAEGVGIPPEEIVIDGYRSEGSIIRDGTYTFTLSLEYENAYKPAAEATIYIDTTAPVISVERRTLVFSPDGDGQKDTAEVRYTSNEKVRWNAAILDMDGEIVYSLSSDKTTTLIVWDGTNNDGVLMEDGKYVLVGEFRDPAGNYQYVDPVILTMDTEPVTAELSVPRGFSPNDDGKNDMVEISVDSNRYTDIEWWRILIRNEAGEQVMSFGGEDELPRAVEWDGTFGIEKGGGIVPDGLYRAELSARYIKGNTVEDESHFFNLDTSPPKVEISVSADPFEQSAEGVEGNVYVSVKVVDGGGNIASWTMDILDENGEILRSYAGVGDPSGDITWNTGVDGRPLPASDMYRLLLKVTDEGGNTTEFTEAVPVDILVVRKEGKLFLMVPNIIFGAYKHTLDSAGPAMDERNLESIEQVVSIWKKYPKYRLGLEAHALNIYLGTTREDDEEEILYPLTERRAEAVRKALVARGIPEEKIEVHAYGGQFPIVSVHDKSVWWKNRRVEFIMIPPETESGE